jgi:hypothetical protein
MIDLMEDHLDVAISSLAITARLILRYGRALAEQGAEASTRGATPSGDPPLVDDPDGHPAQGNGSA